MSLNSNTDLALINTTNNSGSITLPIASSIPGRVITFKDNVGNFTNNNFTLICAGSDTFEDGTTSKVFNESFGFIQIVASGTKWYILCGVKQNTMTQSTLYVSTISTFSIQFSDGSFQTISADKNINSSIIGLGSIGYISSSQLTSTTLGLVDHLELNSTIAGLGNIGYISSIQLISTVRGLGNIGYLSSFNSISSLNISSGNLFANTFTTRSISTNLISSASNYTSVQFANSYNGLTLGGNINMNGGVFPTSGANRDLGGSGNFRWNNFWVSTISSIHVETSTLNVQNTLNALTIAALTVSTQNIIGFNLLGTTILSTQAIFCSSIQIGPTDAILDIVGPIRAQDMSTVTLQASTITAGTMTLNTLFGGPTVVNTTYTQNLYPLTTGAQVGFTTALAGLPGFYASGNFASTFTRVIQPTLDNDGFSNIVIINGSVSTPNMFTSTIFNRNFISTPIVVCSNLVGIGTGNSIFSQNFYPQGVNVLGFGTGGPGTGPWDSASVRQTLTSSIITNNISTANIFVSSIFTNNINASSLRVFGTLSTANMQVSSIVSGNFTLATGALVQKVVTSAVAPSGTVSLDLTQGNVFSFTTAMASSAAANFTTLNAVIGSTYYVNFLTGATPGNITFTGNTGATTLSATGSSLIGNPSVYIGLYGAAQSFTPAATTRYMFNCIVIAA